MPHTVDVAPLRAWAWARRRRTPLSTRPCWRSSGTRYQKAAEAGNPWAMRRLAAAFEDGSLGFRCDAELAEEWMDRARAAGYVSDEEVEEEEEEEDVHGEPNGSGGTNGCEQEDSAQ
jgi:hypothetical protein